MANISSHSDLRLYMAPLQGYTDHAFRKAFCSVVDAPDFAFSPFIETHKVENRMYRDVLPERNTSCKLIPQVLGNNSHEILPVMKQLRDMGFEEVNFNMGCPYPMVTKKTMGAGLLPHPDQIDRLLSDIFAENVCRFSVKMRLGLMQHDEWKNLVAILNRYPLSEVIIHGRTASQMYKGDIDIPAFAEFAQQLVHPVCYNGNINTLAQFTGLKTQFPKIDRWMFGRGLLANPLFLHEIRTGEKSEEEDVRIAIEKLHDQLLYINSERLNGTSHVLNKMKPYWEYFAPAFAGREKGLKKIKKAVTLDLYKIAIREVFKG